MHHCDGLSQLIQRAQKYVCRDVHQFSRVYYSPPQHSIANDQSCLSFDESEVAERVSDVSHNAESVADLAQ